MAQVGWEFGAIDEATIFLGYFTDLPDPRPHASARTRGRE